MHDDVVAKAAARRHLHFIPIHLFAILITICIGTVIERSQNIHPPAISLSDNAGLLSTQTTPTYVIKTYSVAQRELEHLGEAGVDLLFSVFGLSIVIYFVDLGLMGWILGTMYSAVSRRGAASLLRAGIAPDAVKRAWSGDIVEGYTILAVLLLFWGGLF